MQSEKIPEDQIQQLIKSAQAGDKEAFGRIYEIYAQSIYNFLFSRLRHKETSEDLVHTVFLKTWNNIRRYQPRKSAKFSTWVFQITQHTLIDYWRVRKQTVELEKVENLANLSQDPEGFEDYEFLWAALSELSLEQQTVLDLRFKQQLSVSETAQVLGKSEVAVRVLQHRAIGALKKKLAGKI
ncbi:MAG: sigma-70 family RNA polymerase sigma factor [Candidatus Doudnabacteria bacterium]|nr:sigma-70 family RNA polymerase sigma factor [Candidatus Doudnabacteria bacterium]